MFATVIKPCDRQYVLHLMWIGMLLQNLHLRFIIMYKYCMTGINQRSFILVLVSFQKLYFHLFYLTQALATSNKSCKTASTHAVQIIFRRKSQIK